MPRYVATQSTIRTVAGVDYNVSAGATRVDESHPLYQTYPEIFTRADDDPPEVEQATAAPGEKRGTVKT